MRRVVLMAVATILTLAMAALPIAGEEREATQGEFAVALAKRLGLRADPSESEAMEVLTARGIAPDAGWYAEGPATDLFVVQIQKCIHILLTEISRDLGIQVPPTLNLEVVTPGQQMGPQTIFYQNRDLEKIAPPGQAGKSAGPGSSLSLDIQSPHPYPDGNDDFPAVWSFTYTHPGAGSLRLYFKAFLLEGSDRLVLRDGDGVVRAEYVGRETNKTAFWSSPVAGDTVTLEIHADGSGTAYGITVSEYAFDAPE